MFTLFRSSGAQSVAERAYGAVVEAARRPVFFRDLLVPDTVDGRFELICLHAFLYLHRLKREQPRPAVLGQVFFDTMFADFDQSLREIGVGDLSVGRHIRRMVEGFYGRVAAYEVGLSGDDASLGAALARNVYGTVPDIDPACVAALAGYLRREAEHLEAQPGAALAAGNPLFGEPPLPAGGAVAQGVEATP
jgi:cytochrome b pre-mRNA-processing protein 3